MDVLYLADKPEEGERLFQGAGRSFLFLRCPLADGTTGHLLASPHLVSSSFHAPAAEACFLSPALQHPLSFIQMSRPQRRLF